MTLVAITAACREGTAGRSGEVTAPAEPDITTSLSTVDPAAVDAAAVWTVQPEERITASSTSFTAMVMRLGCNGGSTAPVRTPSVVSRETEVVVTFTVEPPAGAARCPSNDQVAITVDLGEPLGTRTLVDGACLAGAAGTATGYCSPDGLRGPWRLISLTEPLLVGGGSRRFDPPTAPAGLSASQAYASADPGAIGPFHDFALASNGRPPNAFLASYTDEDAGVDHLPVWVFQYPRMQWSGIPSRGLGVPPGTDPPLPADGYVIVGADDGRFVLGATAPPD